jgi:hypothetical protein
MKQGDRVITPQGEGTVTYIRNGPPTYARPEIVSVILDKYRDHLHYTGTVYPIYQVHPWSSPSSAGS